MKKQHSNIIRTDKDQTPSKRKNSTKDQIPERDATADSIQKDRLGYMNGLFEQLKNNSPNHESIYIPHCRRASEIEDV